MSAFAARIEQDGHAIIPDVIHWRIVDVLRGAVGNIDSARSMRGSDVYGARNILTIPEIRALAHDERIVSVAKSVAGSECRPVRGIFFDKTPRANWPVAWHQDLSLAVEERHDTPGWTNWSIKSGVHHVQPPIDLLERMVTLRIHLDESGAENGPLRVLPGTHRMGRITSNKIGALRVSVAEHSCVAPVGSVLVMKPLILHASSAARLPHHRRVIHIEFAPVDLLPEPMRWFDCPEGRG